MKKLLLLVVALIFINCTNCKKNKELLNTKSIELYYIPLGMLSPVDGFDKETITETKKNTIKNKERIESILELVRELKPSSKKNFQTSNIYLRADFITEKGVSKTLLFDKTTFKLESCYYKGEEKLFQLITDGFDWGDKE